jgi:membrane-associated phospholipid phosphatase
MIHPTYFCKMLKNVFCLFLFSFFISLRTYSQTEILLDSNNVNNKIEDSIVLKKNEQIYHLRNGKTLIYTKPRSFSFLTNLPKDFAGIGKAPFKKNAIKPILLVASTSVLLILADQSITDGVEKFSSNISLRPNEEYKDILTINAGKTKISLLKSPQNINTALYQLGQGFPSLLISAGLFTYGKIKKDYRALSTANQLAESFILMGVGTQLLKRISGRQTPIASTKHGGEWNLFPSFKAYQTNTPFFDAFPSGHLATLMSTVTILTENYPEKKWLKPVGYSIVGLVGYSMVNNKVHWAGDYPLAIALGYLCAKQVVKRNRKVLNTNGITKKHKGSLSYSFDYANGRLIPSVVYKF